MVPFAALAAYTVFVIVFTAVDANIVAVDIANVIVFDVCVTVFTMACIPVYTFRTPRFSVLALMGVNFCRIIAPEDVATAFTFSEQVVEATLAVLFIVTTNVHIAQSHDFTAVMANAVFVGAVWAKPNTLDVTPAVLNSLNLRAVENLVAVYTFKLHLFQNISHLFIRCSVVGSVAVYYRFTATECI
jgi:hypothetical protein